MTRLHFRDDEAAADLRTFATRARRLDPAAALRLLARGEVLAVYAGVLHGGGGPTVLALRTQSLAPAEPGAEPADVDVTVPAGALLDRLAVGADSRQEHAPAGRVEGRVVEVPDLSTPQAGWAGLLPPRVGWSFEGLVPPETLTRAAIAGIDEVAAGTPQAAGSAAVTRLRALVWGRDLPGLPELPGLPAGVAFAADAFGFVPRGVTDDAITLHRAGAWWRLSTTRGHVLARTGLL